MSVGGSLQGGGGQGSDPAGVCPARTGGPPPPSDLPLSPGSPVSTGSSRVACTHAFEPFPRNSV